MARDREVEVVVVAGTASDRELAAPCWLLWLFGALSWPSTGLGVVRWWRTRRGGHRADLFEALVAGGLAQALDDAICVAC